jgi:hypothetical protein
MIKHKLKSVATGAAATLLIAAAPAAVLAKSSDSNSNAHNKVTICHGTGSQSNPFVIITPNANGVVNGHEAHQDANDIIPSFTYNDHGVVKTFPGQNLDSGGQAILDNGCKVTGGEGGGPQKDCDNDFDSSPATECQTVTGPTMDCDGDTDSSPATECPTGGLGGGTTTTVNNQGQVLAATTAGGQTTVQNQQVQTPQGGVGAGFGGAAVSSNPAAVFGLGGSLLSLGTGLALFNRRQSQL